MADTEQALEDAQDKGQAKSDGEQERRGSGVKAPGPSESPAGEGRTIDSAGDQFDAQAQDHEAAEVEEDLGELLATAAQRDEYLALAQRTQADFENYRKRVAKESAQAQARGVGKLAKELLPALDSLDRALASAAQDDPLLAGVRLVRSELIAALERVGIEPFAPQGEPFDPVEQEAVAQQPVEGVQSGTVAEVYQTGYRLSGAVIRPARVLVAA
ncbi:MAG TPA: nucleotide exchange factor GrpE [Solirubrobacteraceae bacterium]|jgi:molecular chaperone GrpE